ncbi:selenoprotein S-like [Bacillus rossius redtenbacheri]|uniref:selenoprotein S-like n=1 Tax=Bacillus rossius redtenbacheri TaxID=93214 RepID=UPI002FDDA0D3
MLGLDWAGELVVAYGWYVLGAALLGGWLWQRCSCLLWRWLEDREDRRRTEYLLEHPEVSEQRMRELDAARRRMQSEYDAKAALAAERRKELEEQRRQEFLNQHRADPGHRLSDGAGTSASKSLRAEHNPLSGPSGSGRYRPARPSCPGGGCGR